MLFTKLPVAVPDNTLPVVPTNQIDLLLDFEEDSLEHWVFNSGNASLIGLNNQLSLTIQGNSPTFGGNYVEVQTTPGDSLVTPFADRTEVTYAAIMQVPEITGDIPIFIGNLEESSVSQGSSLYMASPNGKIYHNVRGFGTGSNYGITDYNMLQPGSWIFVAGSYRSDGANLNSAINIVLAGKETYRTAQLLDFDGDKLLDDDNFAIGNPVYSGSTVDQAPTVKFMEAVFFDRFMDVEELRGLYQRAKERAARVGIELVGD